MIKTLWHKPVRPVDCPRPSQDPWDWDEPWSLPKKCTNPGHEPPNMMVITRTYRHVCPGCGFSCTLYPTIVRM